MNKPKNYNAKLIAKKELNEYIFEYKFELDGELTFEPGQFVNVRVYEMIHRPFSIVDVTGNVITLIADIRPTVPGYGSGFFKNVQIGDKTVITGPIGRFTLKESHLEKVFISTGAGLAPFVPMIRKLINEGKRDSRIAPTLFHGMRYLNHEVPLHYFKNEISNLELNYIRCITKDEIPEDKDGIINFSGRVYSALTYVHSRGDSRIVPTNSEFYICGSNEMVKDVKAKLLSEGATQIFVENYG